MEYDTLFSCDSKKYEKTLCIVSMVTMLIMLVAQLVLIFTFNGNQTSDAQVYVNYAKKAAQIGVWYPSYLNLHDTYIFGNGYINLLILSLRLTGSFYPAYVMNVMFTFVILFSCRYILKKICPTSQAYLWFTIIFCLFGSFWGETVALRTELAFAAMAFLGFAFIFSDIKIKYLICGAILAIANWVRPLALAFLIGAVVYIIIKHGKLRSLALLLAGYVAVICIIGFSTYFSFGHFVYQSETMGYNLLIGANDDADGTTDFDVFLVPGKIGYIAKEEQEGMTFRDFDNFYKKQAVNWILQNPVHYMKLLPKKVFYLFATETYSGSSFFNNETETSGIDYIKSLAAKLTGRGDSPLALGDLIMIWTQLLYMASFVLFLIGTVAMFTRRYWLRMLPLYFIFAAASAITLLFVGGARYHFPLLPIIMMTAAAYLQQLFARKLINKKSKNIAQTS